MRYLTLAGFMLTMILGCSHTTTVSGVETVTLDSLATKGDAFAEAMRSGTGMIVHIEKGEKVPIGISASLPFAELHAGDNSLIATEDFYLFFSKKDALISRDGVNFTPLYDMKGLKKMYGFKNGNVSLGFGVTKDTPPSLSVGVSTH